MNVTFTYDAHKEVDTLRVGFSSQNSQKPTAFAEEAKAAGIDFTSEEQVAGFATSKIEKEEIPVSELISQFQVAWNPVQEEATKRFQRIFQTKWTPGEVTAYLTLSTRCPYNFLNRYYFVSIGKEEKTPVGTSLHELIHFYTHQLIEPLFVEVEVGSSYNEFKEALTVLLNVEFADLIENEDKGYPRHAELRMEIEKRWQEGVNMRDMAQEFIAKQLK